MFGRDLSAFSRDEHGSATIEAVLWLPFFILFFVMVLDAAMIFANQARILRIVQDGNRAYAVGGIADCDAAKVWVESRVQPLAPSAVASCDRSSGISTLEVSMNSGDLDLSGAAGVFGGLSVVARSQHFVELGS
jgi:hypothetical protein